MSVSMSQVRVQMIIASLQLRRLTALGLSWLAVGSHRKYGASPRPGHCKDTIFTGYLRSQQKITQIVLGNII